MSWAWFTLCPDPPAGTMATAAVFTSNGDAAGFLAAWSPDADHPPTAAKIDGRAIDPLGKPGWASLVLAPEGLFLPFDDLAVSASLRRILVMPPAAVFSTLLVGDDRLVGALTAEHELTGRLNHDPFVNLFPALMLRVGGGILGTMPAPAGPTIQRYGADNPWPWDRFSSETDR